MMLRRGHHYGARTVRDLHPSLRMFGSLRFVTALLRARPPPLLVLWQLASRLSLACCVGS